MSPPLIVVTAELLWQLRVRLRGAVKLARKYDRCFARFLYLVMQLVSIALRFQGELKPRWLYGRTTRVRQHPHICTRLGYRCYAHTPMGTGRKLRKVTKTLRF